LGRWLASNAFTYLCLSAAYFRAALLPTADGTLNGNGRVVLNGVINTFNVADFDFGGGGTRVRNRLTVSGTSAATIFDTDVAAFFHGETAGHIVRAGLNYKF